jgi:hypothetical protein
MVDQPTLRPPPPARNRRRMAEDLLLLPLALILEFWNGIIWRGSLALLNALSRTATLARLRRTLQTLPPWIVLLLFLIPEALDHLSGFWATMLFVHGNLLGATLVAVFIKGSAILIALWIYQSSEQNLMSVRWFATLHDRVIASKNWVLDRTAPIRARVTAPLNRSSYLTRRLSAWRFYLSRFVRQRFG